MAEQMGSREVPFGTPYSVFLSVWQTPLGPWMAPCPLRPSGSWLFNNSSQALSLSRVPLVPVAPCRQLSNSQWRSAYNTFLFRILTSDQALSKPLLQEPPQAKAHCPPDTDQWVLG